MNTIYRYTTQQAIDDGALIHPYPARYPKLLITPDIHIACKNAKRIDGRTYDQSLIPLIIDAILEVRAAADRPKATWPLRLQDTIAGDVLIAPNDLRGITIMTTSEY
jgi:hypothetical protein